MSKINLQVCLVEKDATSLVHVKIEGSSKTHCGIDAEQFSNVTDIYYDEELNHVVIDDWKLCKRCAIKALKNKKQTEDIWSKIPKDFNGDRSREFFRVAKELGYIKKGKLIDGGILY